MITTVQWEYVLLTGAGGGTSHRVARSTAPGRGLVQVEAGADSPGTNDWSRTARPSIFNGRTAVTTSSRSGGCG